MEGRSFSPAQPAGAQVHSDLVLLFSLALADTASAGAVRRTQRFSGSLGLVMAEACIGLTAMGGARVKGPMLSAPGSFQVLKRKVDSANKTGSVRPML